MTAPTRETLSAALVAHWRHRADAEAIRLDLARRGRDLTALTLEDLAPHDQLHAGGLEATRLFAAWAAVPEGARILDLGAGLGGAARLLAKEHGCRVTALDLSPDLTATGALLTEWLGLGDRVTHLAGELPALRASAGYDRLWIQHLDIHLREKRAFYAACAPHLAPGGRVLWHDWLAGPAGPPRYPLPWSADGALSFLASEQELRSLLPEMGLRLTRLEAVAERTRAWYEKLEGALVRALGREPDAPGKSGPGARQAALLTETRAVLENLSEARLVPFFAEAEPS